MSDELRDDSFDSVKERLDQIAEDVAREDLPLDEALALYEEAVKLGLRACDLSEIGPFDAQEDAPEAQAAPPAQVQPQGAPEQAGASDEPAAQVADAAPFAAVRIDDGASVSFPGAGSDL